MMYLNHNGEIVKADTPEELARALWQSRSDTYPTLQEWMAANVRLAMQQNAAHLRTDTVEHHISDMLSANLIERVE